MTNEASKTFALPKIERQFTIPSFVIKVISRDAPFTELVAYPITTIPFKALCDQESRYTNFFYHKI